MKVYLVAAGEDQDRQQTLGVFSDATKAQEFVRAWNTHHVYDGRCSMDEQVLDPSINDYYPRGLWAYDVEMDLDGGRPEACAAELDLTEGVHERYGRIWAVVLADCEEHAIEILEQRRRSWLARNGTCNPCDK